MLGLIQRLWRHGIGTIPKQRLPIVVGNGKPGLDVSRCDGCGDCVRACPTDAITLSATQELLTISYAACVTCGVCIDTCPTSAFLRTHDPLPIVTNRADLVTQYPIPKRLAYREGEWQNGDVGRTDYGTD